MPYELRVRIYGSSINLLIGVIRKDQRDALLEYCKNYDKKLKRIWYFPTKDEQEFMADLFRTKDPWFYDKIRSVFEVNGMVFHDKIQIQDFLKDALSRPTIDEIYLNRKITTFDRSKIVCRYQGGIELPRLTEDQVFVHYGFIDRLAVTYRLSTELPVFDETKLEFHFTDCDEYGVVLSHMLYQGKAPEKVSRGSTAVHVLELKFL